MIKIIGSLLFSLVSCSIVADRVPVRQSVKAQKQKSQVDRHSNQQSKKEKPYVAAELILHKNRVVVSERVPYTIRVVYDPQTTDVTQVVPPEFGNAVTEELKGPVKERRMIDNRYCMVYEWTGAVYPNKEGQLQLPPVRVEYVNKIRDSKRGSFFGSFFTAFDHSANVMYSQAPQLLVEQIHDGLKGKNYLVGGFSDAQISFDKNEITQGDAAILQYIVTGSGNLSQISHPRIILPAGLKCYASESRNLPKGRLFEYVVQTTKPGFFMIPVQRLAYFDTETRTIRELRSDPIEITVKADKKVRVTEDDLTREQSQALTVADSGEQEVTSSVSDQVIGPSLVRRMILPAWLFWLVLFGFGSVAFFRGFVEQCSVPFIVLARWRSRRLLLKKIRRLLEVNGSSDKAERLYALFQKLQSRVDWETLRKEHSQLLVEWNYCFDDLVHIHFGKAQVVSGDFFQRAQKLINKLEKGAWFL